jgi:hypothetical protein
MGESSDLGYATLNSMSNNFIRLETLKEANDKVSNATAGLAIFHHYDIGFSYKCAIYPVKKLLTHASHPLIGG